MNICVISPDYPTDRTISFIFVDQVCRALADSGFNVTIISPQSITKCIFNHIPITPFKSLIQTRKGNRITLYRPKTITFGSLGLKCRFVGKLNLILFNLATRLAFNKTQKKYDVLYGHFWNAVYAAYKIAKSNNISVIASSGEENITLQNVLTLPQKQGLLQYLNGVINVSTKNREESVKAGLCNYNVCEVIPNGFDDKKFFKTNKLLQRKKLGYSKKIFIVAFVGQFVERKGIHILSQAMELLNDENIYALFIGSGPLRASYQRILYSGTVPHDFLNNYLSSADVFVLPTTNEGCSNAIIEAMACGLPIISSNKSFNYDILDNENSILIDPENVEEVARAIKIIKSDDDLRKRLSNNSLEKAKELSLEIRVQKIKKFITSRI